MTILFVSDLHLSPDNPYLTDLFIQFLTQQTETANALYILGDFFDRWIGMDEQTIVQRDVIKALSTSSKQGLKIYFMPGNRDFLINKQFSKSTGCQLLSDPHVIELYGTKTLLKHGDDLIKHDYLHRLFRVLARSSLIKNIFLKFPLGTRQTIAKKIRNISKQRHKHRHTQTEVYDEIPQRTVKKLMRRHQVTQFIHGHTHLPTLAYFNMDEQIKRYIVLSDWQQQGNVLVYSPDNRVQLKYFS